VSATTKRRTAAKGSKGSSRGRAARSSRKLVVSVSLLMVLGLTSALLLALAPAPLTPGAASSLFAVEPPKSLDVIFETAVPLKAGRWSHIYIHHSQTLSGSAATLGAGAGGVADHFVIGNGDGCADGELQIAQRWNRQQPAGPLPGVSQMDPSCISICLVGDFNRTHPTRTQMRRLAQLVSALQGRLGVPAEQVWAIDGVAGPGGVGRLFPAAEFRKELLP
jgi:hypothetical protein